MSADRQGMAMNRLTQLGIFCIVLGGVMLFLGLFPFAVDAEAAPGIGVSQIFIMLLGLFLVIIGAYTIVYATMHRGQPRTLRRDVGVRLGMTGLVFSAGAMLADMLGYGSHAPDGALFGLVQAVGMLVGFLIAACGVLVYGFVQK